MLVGREEGGGGIIRNSHRDQVYGYARVIGFIASMVAELWPLRDGIKMCINLNLADVEIKLEVKLVVDLLQKDARSFNGTEVIVADCKEYLKKFLELESNIVLGKPTSVLMHLLEEVPPSSGFCYFFYSPNRCFPFAQSKHCWDYV